MDIVNVIIQLISGVFGGNAAGSAMKDKSLGAVGNSIIGLLGGGLGGFILQLIQGTAAAGATNFNIESIIASVISGGAGGGVLTAIIAFIKSAMKK
ncbi:hypothetical protein [Legionella sp. CNM-4043-24]|uniref:hypothetical protein n=1 Tax=Legionella sp. CNM-4043-24 TaxID=3421646 RepID=UPI00403AAF85